jgi:hypothetical protein
LKRKVSPEQDVQAGIRREEMKEIAGKESKLKGCGKEKEIGDFLHIDPYKTEIMLEEHDEEDCLIHIILAY